MSFKKEIVFASSVLALSPLLVDAKEARQVEKEKPNVVVILVDDQGYGGVSCYPQNYPIETPNIDKLANEGVRFTQGYTSGQFSSPTRAGLLTGKYQQSFGFYSLAEPAAGGVPQDQKMISQYMKENGYRTAAIGKWHVGDNIPNHPNNRGYDYFYGFVDGIHDYFDPVVGGSWSGWFNGVAFVMEGYDPVVEMDYATYEFTDRAIDFINEDSDDPFFLYLPYNAIHSPLQAPEELIKKVAKNPAKPTPQEKVHAMTIALDNSVGRVVDALEAKGVRDNTLIFYLSDNGGAKNSDVWDLRGNKGSYYEGGIRVPFIINWKNNIPEGQVIEEPIISLDIAPTILAATGMKQTDMDGVDLIPYMTGKKSGEIHDVLYWSVEKGDDKDVYKNEFAIRKGNWKLVSDPKQQKDYNLYNLESDPFEQNGLKDKYPEKYEELFALYLQWINKMPPSLTETWYQRADGKALMNRYQNNFKKVHNRVPSIRAVDINDPELNIDLD